MKEKLLGIYFIIMGLMIYILYFVGYLNNFLASKMIVFSLITGVIFLISGILILCNKIRNITLKKDSLLLIVPVIMIFVAGNGELSLELAKKRANNLALTGVSSTQSFTDTESDVVLNNNEEVLYELNDSNYVITLNKLYENIDNIEGSKIIIRGFTIKDTSVITAGYFIIGKYIVSCCVADAGVVGILVKEELISVNDNEWYEIEGVINVIEDNTGSKTIAITPTTIESIESENMYVYQTYAFLQGDYN